MSASDPNTSIFLTDTDKQIKNKVYCLTFTFLSFLTFEPVREKTNNLGSDQVQRNPACTVIEDGYRLEILDLESRGIIVLSM